MSASRLVNGRSRPRRGVAGYSLIEMMIALGIAAVIGAGLFAVYNAQQRSSRKQRGFIALQTDCNLVMDQMKQELLLAGYRGDETPLVKTFTDADAGTVTFEYFDDKAKFNDASPSEPAYDSGVPWDAQYSEHTQVRYLLNGGSLERRIKRWHRATSTYLAEGTQVLADNIQALSFEFDRGDNSAIGLPASTADLDAIRNVKIELACRSPKIDPISGRQLNVALTASVAPRNVGLEANPKDSTAPAIPSELVAWDLGTCGSLRLRWKANTEADLDGYTIFYGLASGEYSKRARLNRGAGTAGQFEYYTLTDLTATTYAAANASPPTPARYHIVITAFDKSGNQSSYSAEVANSAQSVTTEPAANAFGSAASDTTINPAPPPDPSPFTVTPAEGALALAWSTGFDRGSPGVPALPGRELGQFHAGRRRDGPGQLHRRVGRTRSKCRQLPGRRPARLPDLLLQARRRPLRRHAPDRQPRRPGQRCAARQPGPGHPADRGALRLRQNHSLAAERHRGRFRSHRDLLQQGGPGQQQLPGAAV